MTAILAWIKANPLAVVAITAWLVVNVLPRPNPDKHTGWRRALWIIADRISFLTAEDLPGKLKPFLVASPPSIRPPPPAPVPVIEPEAAAKTPTPDEKKDI